ncbi:MAG: helix-turn-helix domain-containing protein [Treponema sp.]|nr:helix-turn-helix domain-containing protein [Treponema sp.]
MESYGALLKNAREERQLDFETISRDTTITSQYLQALEEENEAAFPGEPYLVGFLSNYADYLGLDSSKVTGLYRAKRIQESPIPTNLIIKRKPGYFIPLVIAACVLGAALVVAIVLLTLHISEMRRIKVAMAVEESTKHTIELSDKPFSGRIYKGDQVLFISPAGKIIITVAQTQGKLALETPVGMQVIELSEEVDLDVDGDNVADMILYVSDISTTDTDRGAEVRILLKNGASVINHVTDTSEIPNIEDLPSEQQRTVILEDSRAYPITVQAAFRAGCVFRYRPDRKETTEDYFASGDIVNITANNGVRLWMSNGNAVKIQLIAAGKTFDLGVANPGEVVAQDIRWIKDTDGKYKVVISDVP